MIAHLLGGGPQDGRTIVVEENTERVEFPVALTPLDAEPEFGTAAYVRESADPDEMLATFRFKGWP